MRDGLRTDGRPLWAMWRFDIAYTKSGGREEIYVGKVRNFWIRREPELCRRLGANHFVS